MFLIDQHTVDRPVKCLQDGIATLTLEGGTWTRLLVVSFCYATDSALVVGGESTVG